MRERRIRPMPYKQNDLFQLGEDVHLNACVGTNGGPYDFDAYSRGYFDAAKRLARSLTDDPSLVDLVIYPLVFTFRHAIELGLKDLGGLLPLAWDEECKIRHTHALVDNWAIVRPYVTREPVFTPDASLATSVDQVLKDIVEVDASGEAFRFPEGRRGNAFLQDMSIINVVVFAKAIPSVADAFEFWHEETSEYLKVKLEAEQWC